MELDPLSLFSWIKVLLMTGWFVISVYVSFYLPGKTFLSNFFKEKQKFEQFVVFTVFGIVLWAGQGLVFGYLGMRWLSYLYRRIA